ncbi:capsid triplex subunit 1 [Saimiriine betaherpesvirus 4]|uniref:Capsid triplex subunit 1 n=1 Tax=Saimiriine betaherpesvirus 4 TaxID=1535247 RepID=G8XSW0_9BETA|nr:capsid triplex subunit 1 [Saimiriine betaherpesvirus 4]AEV80906.1 capsid triplex subunit 1 [Saimiriine betaherpesvirus 4]
MASEVKKTAVKRTYDDRDTDFRKLIRPEKDVNSIWPRYIYGADHQAVVGRFFVPEALVEFESQSGVLMFVLDTGVESPRTVYVSLFLLATKASNLSANTRCLIVGMYSSSMATMAMTWLDGCLQTLHRRIQTLGCVQSVSLGTTSLVTCVMQGYVYNMLKTDIFALVFPKELYLALDEDSKSGIQYAYLIIVYNWGEVESKPAMYVATTSIFHLPTLIDVLRQRFMRERFEFLNRRVTRPGHFVTCTGVVQKLGWCLREDIHAGVLIRKEVKLSVMRLEHFNVEIGSFKEFV